MSENLSQATNVDPSLIVGNSPQDPLEVQHAIMAEVLPMFELDDVTFNQVVSDFVEKRVADLSTDAETNYVGFSGGGTSKFIGPDTPMLLSNLMSRDYFLDDNAAYTASFGYIRSYYKKLLAKHPDNPDKAYINAVLQGANMGQASYFETWYGVDANARLDLAADIVSEDVDRASIADFKRVAMCQERAGVAHDTLQILGLQSRFEAGTIEVKNEDGSTKSEEHAFVSVRNIDGTKVIFDPTNPKVIKNEDGLIVNATAAIYKMEDANAQTFIGELTESTKTDQGTVESRRREVTYTFKH
jgi:hypothetical protein